MQMLSTSIFKLTTSFAALILVCTSGYAQTASQLKIYQTLLPEPAKVLLYLPHAAPEIVQFDRALHKICENDILPPKNRPTLDRDFAITCEFHHLLSQYVQQINKLNNKASSVQFANTCAICGIEMNNLTSLLAGEWYQRFGVTSNESASAFVAQIIIGQAIVEKSLEAVKGISFFYARDQKEQFLLYEFPFLSAYFSSSNILTSALSYFDALQCGLSNLPCLADKEIWGAYIQKLDAQDGKKIEKLNEDLNVFISSSSGDDINLWRTIRAVVNEVALIDGPDVTFASLVKKNNQYEKNLTHLFHRLTDRPPQFANAAYLRAAVAAVIVLEMRPLVKRRYNFSVYDRAPLNLSLWPNFRKGESRLHHQLQILLNDFVLLTQSEGNQL